MWQAIHKKLKKEGSFESIQWSTVQNKVGDLLSYHEVSGLAFSTGIELMTFQDGLDIAVAGGLSDSAKVTISALLDRALQMKKDAQALSDRQKVAACKVSSHVCASMYFANTAMRRKRLRTKREVKQFRTLLYRSTSGLQKLLLCHLVPLLLALRQNCFQRTSKLVLQAPIVMLPNVSVGMRLKFKTFICSLVPCRQMKNSATSKWRSSLVR